MDIVIQKKKNYKLCNQKHSLHIRFVIETKLSESILRDFLFTRKLQSLFMFDIAQSKN